MHCFALPGQQIETSLLIDDRYVRLRSVQLLTVFLIIADENR